MSNYRQIRKKPIIFVYFVVRSFMTGRLEESPVQLPAYQMQKRG